MKITIRKKYNLMINTNATLAQSMAFETSSPQYKETENI